MCIQLYRETRFPLVPSSHLLYLPSEDFFSIYLVNKYIYIYFHRTSEDSCLKNNDIINLSLSLCFSWNRNEERRDKLVNSFISLTFDRSIDRWTRETGRDDRIYGPGERCEAIPNELEIGFERDTETRIRDRLRTERHNADSPPPLLLSERNGRRG